MTTRIFDLPCLNFTMTAGNNEDWRDSWPYLDAAGSPISLAGIALDFVLWSTATGSIVIAASTGTSVGSLPLNGKIISGGIVTNVAGLRIPRATMQRLAAGSQYNHETQARADGMTKTIARGGVVILWGYTP